MLEGVSPLPATVTAGPRGQAIRRIEIVVFRTDMKDVSFDVSPGGIDRPGARASQAALAIVVETVDGARGEYVGGHAGNVAQTQSVAQRIIGWNCYARESIYEHARCWLRKEDRIGASVIDIALWDLAGKRSQASVSALLGGERRKRLLAYASTWFAGDGGGLSSPGAVADFAEECRGLGYRAFKMHGWTDGDWRKDAEAIRLLGRRLGGAMKLMHDGAGHRRTFGDALACGRACDEAGFLWYENPLSDGGLATHAHRRLRQLIRTPILHGDHVRGLEALATVALADGADVMGADPDLDIGITGTLKIARLAEALGLDVEIHGSGPAQRHAMAAIRNTNFYELGLVGPSRGGPVETVYACGYSDRLDDVGHDGCLEVPDGPGLGVRYDWDLINRNCIDRVVLT